MDQEISPKLNFLLIPIAILVAGTLVAGAVYFGGKNPQIADMNSKQAAQGSRELDRLTPVNDRDHIRGNPNAPVKIVEYSDMECPFCKRFHPTMQQVMAEYGASGQVAWVYRHFPLDQLHPVKARREAVATECANEIAGNQAFWKYLDRFFELTPSNNDTNVDTVLPQIAKELGLDESGFATCLESGKYDQHIEDEVQNALTTGGQGTPWSIIVSKNGKKFPLSGAQPYASVKQLIELALQGK